MIPSAVCSISSPTYRKLVTFRFPIRNASSIFFVTKTVELSFPARRKSSTCGNIKPSSCHFVLYHLNKALSKLDSLQSLFESKSFTLNTTYEMYPPSHKRSFSISIKYHLVLLLVVTKNIHYD